jgi:uncharacterized RDD family membrane protein YckC
MTENLDKLIIDTPEQVQLEFALAGIGSRFMALFVDTLIQFIALMLLFILVVFLGAGAGLSPEMGKWAVALYIFAFFLLYWGYFAIFEALWKGQTPGKRQAGIRVIRDSGREITAKEAIGRNLLRAVDMLPGVYAVGILCVFLSAQNKRLGDYVSGTVVVHDRAPEESQPFWNTREDAEVSFVSIFHPPYASSPQTESRIMSQANCKSQKTRNETSKISSSWLCGSSENRRDTASHCLE